MLGLKCATVDSNGQSAWLLLVRALSDETMNRVVVDVEGGAVQVETNYVAQWWWSNSQR